MSEKLLIYGCSGNSLEVLEIIKDINLKDQKWEVIGFLDDDIDKQGREFYGVPILGGGEKLSSYPDSKVLVSFGSPSSYLKRKNVIENLNIPIERFANIIHPSVCLGDSVILGKNILMMAGVVCTANIKIGNHVTILPNTVISHDSSIGEYSCIGSNVSISGSVNIGTEVYVGSGSKIINDIKIGNRSLIGLGSVVIKDCDENGVYAGNPTRKIKSIAA